MEPTIEQLSDFMELRRLGRVTKENFQEYLDSVRKLIPSGLFQKLLAQANRLTRRMESYERHQAVMFIAEMIGDASAFPDLILEDDAPFRVFDAHFLSVKSRPAGLLRDACLVQARETASSIKDHYYRGVSYAKLARITNDDHDFKKSFFAVAEVQPHRKELVWVELVKSYVANGRLGEARDFALLITDSSCQTEALAVLAEKSQDKGDVMVLVNSAEAVTSSRYNHRTRAEAFARVARVANDAMIFDTAMRHLQRCEDGWDKDKILILIIEAYLAHGNLIEARKIAEEIRSPKYRPQAFAIIAEASGDNEDFSQAQVVLRSSSDPFWGMVLLARALKKYKK